MKGLVCPDCGAHTAITPMYLTHGGVLDYVDGVQAAARSTSVVNV